MSWVILPVLAGFVGGMAGGPEGACAAAALVLALLQRQQILSLRRDVTELQESSARKLRVLEERIAALSALRSPTEVAPPRGAGNAPSVGPLADTAQSVLNVAELPGGVAQPFRSVTQAAVPQGDAVPVDVAPAAEPLPPRASESTPGVPVPPALDQAARFRQWVVGDNPMARVGVLVLLVGVSMLLRIVAQQGLLPVEARLIGVAVLGLGLTALGFRLRTSRTTLAQLLQGAGVASLFLDVFFAYRQFELLPPGLTFGLLVVIAVASGVLAVVQNAASLVFIGTVGGFAAPILASSGTGNHVALFSYYLLLNLLVLSVSWFKGWRALALTGFVATFGVGSVWGALQYQPEHFATTEPFLIAFFLIYVAVNVFTALQRPETLRGAVSSSLTFGLPLVTIGLQANLAGPRDWLVATTALVMAALYYAVARTLLTRKIPVQRTLTDGYLALGIGLATLSVPYALDSQAMISATWVLEAAGLYWVGVRGARWLPRVAAIALLFIGVGSAAESGVWDRVAEDAWPVLNPSTLSAALVLGAVIFLCVTAQRHAQALFRPEATLTQWLSLGAALLWSAALSNEVRAQTSGEASDVIWLALTALSAPPLAWVAARERLKIVRWVSLLVLPLSALVLALMTADHDVVWENLGWLGWPLTVLGVGATLHLQAVHRELPVRGAHVLMSLWLVALGSVLVWQLTRDALEIGVGWSYAALGVFLGGSTWALERVRQLQVEPFLAFAPEYKVASRLFGLALLLFLVVSLGSNGDPEPLPFVPVCNPLDLVTIGLCVLLALYTARQEELRPLRNVGLLLLAFAAGNTLLARAVSHLTDTPYTMDALWLEDTFHVAIAISWTLLGLAGVTWSSRRHHRSAWLLAAALLGVVVVKLFFVDLANLGQIPRVLSFVAVGVLLLAAGYLAPLPPASDEKKLGKEPQ